MPQIETMEHSVKKPVAEEPKLWGLMAEYEDPESLKAAAEKIRDAGFQRWDCCTPYPVHGLDKAMGVRPTILPWLVLGAGLTGFTIAVLLQWYCNSPLTASPQSGLFSGYPLVFSGKPYWGIPANVPIMFELTVLLSAATAFFGVWGLSGLPRPYFPPYNNARFRRVTDDRFFILIEARDSRFVLAQTRQFLLTTEPAAVEEVMD
jgi:hypothetical protein